MTAKGGQRRTRPAPPPPDDDEAWDGEGILTIGEDPDEPKRDVLFRLDGKEYEVCINPPASLMLRYMDRVRKWGPTAAISWLLEELVGGEGYEALLASPKVSQKDFGRISDAAVRIVMGRAAAPKSRTSR